MDLELAIAIWGAALATFLAALRVLDRRREIKYQLQVVATVDPPSYNLRIDITNAGPRPVIVKRVDVYYAGVTDHLIADVTQRLPVELREPQFWELEIPREDLVEAARRSGAVQSRYRSIRVTAITSTGQQVSRLARIHPSIIPQDYLKSAEGWIATDVFLGFSQQKSEVGHPPVNLLK